MQPAKADDLRVQGFKDSRVQVIKCSVKPITP